MKLPAIKTAAALALGLLTGAKPVLAQRALGIDVSAYQGASINWTAVQASGISFAWTKAAEATPSDGYLDPTADFTINENNGKAAGVRIGAYYFAHPELDSAATAASYFWSVAGPYILADGKTLMPMLDMEVFKGHVAASSFSDWLNQWCNAIVSNALAAGVIVKPVIYVSACNASYFDSSIAKWIPWIADYNKANAQTGTPWSTCAADDVWGSGTWSVWQYTSSGTVSGVSGNVDMDVFNGDSNAMIATLVATRSAPPVKSISLVGNLAFGNVAVGAVGQSTLAIVNTGNTVLTVSGITCPAGFSGNWSGTIPVNGSESLWMYFSPALAARYSGAVVVNSDAASGVNTISTSGTGSSNDPTNNPPIIINAMTQPANIVLSWPTNAVGFELEFSTNLGPSAIWAPVAGSAVFESGQNTYTVPASGQQLFFRLHQH